MKRELFKRNWFTISSTFELPDAVSPEAVGYNKDRRVLALAFRSLRMSDE